MEASSINPHDQSIVGKILLTPPEMIVPIVEKSRKASDKWKNTPIEERIQYIKIYKEKLLLKKESLAKLIAQEMGRPYKYVLLDINWEMQYVDYYIQECVRILEDKIIIQTKNDFFRLSYEPHGICVCIPPWNFPLSMAHSGMLPALIAGNSVILKPSSSCMLSQAFIIDLLVSSGFPEGVVQCVIGTGEIAEKLLDEDIDCVWFTGSTQVGRNVFKKCGEKFIKSIVEMGGSSPAIVFKDAPLQESLNQIFFSRFNNSGQTCKAIKRLYVEESIFQEAVTILVEKAKNIIIGDPLNDRNEMGPVVSKKQLALLKEQLQDALDKGATIQYGGQQLIDEHHIKGNYIQPTIVTGIKENMRIVTEEVFGPILPVIAFSSDQEAIRLANQTPYGLTAEIYTLNHLKATEIAKKIESGVVAINTDRFYKPVSPIGGFKQSGMGKSYGEIGIQEFCKVKLIAETRLL
jgi:succinate-semialdehyde dehydrogenase/glutarate-semialdehyde dehydrogenase